MLLIIDFSKRRKRFSFILYVCKCSRVSCVVFIMKCAVIKIAISLIISEICLAAGDIGNQLEIIDGPSIKIQSCVAKVIEHIWNPSESLVFAINSHQDYIPSRLPNPVTIVDVRVPLPTHYKRYEVNYVIEAESRELFGGTLDTLRRSPLWHPNETPKGKFVILIKEENELQMIFFTMWRVLFALHIVVVIYEDTSKNCPIKVITSNPQAEGNNCARLPTVFSNFSCDNISLAFLKPIRNYNGCPVFINIGLSIDEFDFNLKRHRVMYNLLAGLNRTLNVTPILLVKKNIKLGIEAESRNEVVIWERYFGNGENCENSIIFSRRLFLWVSKKATRISPLDTLFLPFKYDLWIAVLFITILIILLKWMIVKGNGYNNNNYVNLACAFTDIIGLTFGVCVNRIPNIGSLKLLLGFFLVYMIHIHIAYTSDLINILTLPRYDGLISNVEQVADGGFPIVTLYLNARDYFKDDTDGGDGLFGKVVKLMTKNYRLLNKKKQAFLVIDEDLAKAVQLNFLRNLCKRSDSVFLTSDIFGEIKEVFYLKNGSYFVESLNALITHLWESGTHEADAHLNLSPYKIKESGSVWNTFSKDKNVRPLHLQDLLPIFVILLICFSFCITIFVAEIFVHKIVALLHSTRNRVVPLNV